MKLSVDKSVSFGEEILRYRSRNNLSQEKMGKLLGVEKLTVLRWENGICKPSKVVLERFRVLSEQEKK